MGVGSEWPDDELSGCRSDDKLLLILFLLMLLVRAPIIDDGPVSILSKTLVIGRRAVADEFD